MHALSAKNLGFDLQEYPSNECKNMDDVILHGSGRGRDTITYMYCGMQENEYIQLLCRQAKHIKEIIVHAGLFTSIRGTVTSC